jgi:quercetin dioxygenase-like cupin family protein
MVGAPSTADPALKPQTNRESDHIMAKIGQSITNKITGETITWLETAATSQGEQLRFNFAVRPKGMLPVRHLHPRQEETFAMKAGTLKVEVNGQIHHLQAGERLNIPQGAPHQWWNEGDEAAELTVTFTPALNTETFLEQFFGLCNSGKSRADGTPHFLQLMALVNEYELYVAGPPLPIQKVMGTVLGGFARLLGLKKFYPAYSKR